MEPIPINNEEEDDEGEVYDVERIVSHKKKGKRVEFLVKWVNYSDSENTWEPEDHLETAEEKLHDYFDSLPDSEREKVYHLSPLIRKIFKDEPLPFEKEPNDSFQSKTTKEKSDAEKTNAKQQTNETDSDSKIDDDNYSFYQRQNAESEEEEGEAVPSSVTRRRKSQNSKKESFNIKGARRENGDLLWAVETNGKMVVLQNRTMKRYHQYQLIDFYESHILLC